MTTSRQRFLARPLLCRLHLWHRWERKRIRLLHSGVVAQLYVCRRCHIVEWPL